MNYKVFCVNIEVQYEFLKRHCQCNINQVSDH